MARRVKYAPLRSVVELRDWAVVEPEDPYLAPEIRRSRRMLTGRVSGHPEMPDGAPIRTSQIAAARGRSVTVDSGRVYELVGAPAPSYRRFLREHGLRFDERNPVVVHA